MLQIWSSGYDARFTRERSGVRSPLSVLTLRFYQQRIIFFLIVNKSNLKVFFDQYLRDPRVPTLEYSIQNGILKYKWTNTIDGFHMPLEISAGDSNFKIHPTNDIQEMNLNYGDINIDRDYYVFKSKVN